MPLPVGFMDILQDGQIIKDSQGWGADHSGEEFHDKWKD